MVRAALALLVVVTALGAAACGGSDDEVEAGPAGIGELETIDQLQAVFEEDAGSARLLLLLSPT